jgi:hypothetical protein
MLPVDKPTAPPLAQALQIGHYALVADAVEVILGDGERERITLTVRGRSHPTCTDYWDGNWLRTNVSVRIGGFSGSYVANLRAEEFRSFGDEMTSLYSALEGDATFTTMEGQVSLLLSGDGMGHVSVKADLSDEAGIGNRLHCEFVIDQTYLPAIIDALGAIDSAWPVLGRP